MFRVGCVAGGRPCTPRRRTTTSCVSPTRRWRRCSAACSRCSPQPGTSRSRCPARSPRRSRYARSRCSPTRPAWRVADPLGGSYYVEALTDEMEARVVEIMDDLERRGGMVRAVEDGYLQRLISEEAFRVQQAIASGERTIVGVNRFARRGAARGRGLRDRREGPAAPARTARRGEALALRRRRANHLAALGKRPPRRRQPHAAPDRLRQGVLHRRGDGRRAQGPVGRVPAAGLVF